MKRLLFSPLVLFFLASTALAHGGGEEEGPRDFHDLASDWGREPGSVLFLVLLALLYGRGLLRMRGISPRLVRRSDVAFFTAGWIVLFIALASPLHSWGEVLFSAHMVQHELLMLVAAPLLVLGRPLPAFLHALPSGWASGAVRLFNGSGWHRLGRWVLHPFSAWLIHAAVLWVWHAPFLFQAATENDGIHFLQHASFLGSALLFWWAVIHGRQRALGFGAAVLYMFGTAIHSGLLGALLTFSDSPWYPVYDETTAPWGLTPLQDQQLGGLIMWIPAGLVYVAAGLLLLVGWMRESERRVRRSESETTAPPCASPKEG